MTKSDYVMAISAGISASVFIFIFLVMIVKMFKQKERKWLRGSNGVWKCCECGHENCNVCKWGKI